MIKYEYRFVRTDDADTFEELIVKAGKKGFRYVGQGGNRGYWKFTALMERAIEETEL